MNWSDKLLDFVYPRSCLGCGVEEVFLCDQCRLDVEIGEQICPECGEESSFGWTHRGCVSELGMDGLICLYSYEDIRVKKAIDEFKFGFNREMAGLLMKDFRFESGENFDLIVPIPLHFYRENWRGFNQAELIARELGKGMGVDVGKVLKRTKKTKQQSLLKEKEERESNLKGAFCVAGGMSLKGKKVLLVDDVFTSGMSMREACRVLKDAGVGMVWGLVLAH